MVLFFFYQNLTNVELINKIYNQFEMNDEYISEQKYDSEQNILEISDKSVNNNMLLYGKMVKFNMKLGNIILKINEMEECKFKNKNTKYILNKVLVNKNSGETCNAFILY